MSEKSQDSELEALHAEIARLREEIAGLVAGVRNSAAADGDQPHANHGAENQSMWADLLRKFDASRCQGEKVVRDLATEVKQHPLVSIMAAFGLGYIISKLWYKANEQ